MVESRDWTEESIVLVGGWWWRWIWRFWWFFMVSRWVRGVGLGFWIFEVGTLSLWVEGKWFGRWLVRK